MLLLLLLSLNILKLSPNSHSLKSLLLLLSAQKNLKALSALLMIWSIMTSFLSTPFRGLSSVSGPVADPSPPSGSTYSLSPLPSLIFIWCILRPLKHILIYCNLQLSVWAFFFLFLAQILEAINTLCAGESRIYFSDLKLSPEFYIQSTHSASALSSPFLPTGSSWNHPLQLMATPLFLSQSKLLVSTWTCFSFIRYNSSFKTNTASLNRMQLSSRKMTMQQYGWTLNTVLSSNRVKQEYTQYNLMSVMLPITHMVGMLTSTTRTQVRLPGPALRRSHLKGKQSFGVEMCHLLTVVAATCK